MTQKFILLIFCAFVLAGCIKTEGEKNREALHRVICLIAAGSKEETAGLPPKVLYSKIKKLYSELNFPKPESERAEMEAVHRALDNCERLIPDAKLGEKANSEILRRINNSRKALKEHYTKQEMKIFKSRTGNRSVCRLVDGTPISINGIAAGYGAPPSRKCVYPNTGELRVLQLVEGGAIVRLSNYGYGSDTIFLRNKGGRLDHLVDGSIIGTGRYFTYNGKFSYPSILGKRTVHSYTPLAIHPYKGLHFIN